MICFIGSKLMLLEGDDLIEWCICIFARRKVFISFYQVIIF